MRHVAARLSIIFVVAIWIAMAVGVSGRLGNDFTYATRQYAPLVGALLGACLTLLTAGRPKMLPAETAEEAREPISWFPIGIGLLCWGAGWGFWIWNNLKGQAIFPSYADIGYASFPALFLCGMLLRPPRRASLRWLPFLIDSMIAAGALVALSWYLWLGPLVLNVLKDPQPANQLWLLYPIADTILLSCIVILSLGRQQMSTQQIPQRLAIFALGLGLCFFIASDFAFTYRPTASLPADLSWLTIGWSLGMILMGLAALLRHMPFTASRPWQQRLQQALEKLFPFNPVQLLPALLAASLLVVLSANSLSAQDRSQHFLYPVLLAATLLVVGLILVRLAITLGENERLKLKQAQLLREQQRLSEVNPSTNTELEDGIEHLQEILARLANGDLQARANLPKGDLWPLGQNINILAGRLARAAGRKTAQPGHVVETPSQLTDMFPALPKVLSKSQKDQAQGAS